MRKLRVSERLCYELKKSDIENEAIFYLSYGVESGGEKHNIPHTVKQKMECSAMKFVHKIKNFKINGVDIDCSDICVNYNRSGNILIGMDILKDWDIHIGTTNLEETIFLACPRNQLNVDYYNELYLTFGIKIQKSSV